MAHYLTYDEVKGRISKGGKIVSSFVEHPIASTMLIIATGYTVGLIIGAIKGIPVGSLIQVTVGK